MKFRKLFSKRNRVNKLSKSKGPVIVIGSAEGEGLSADVREQLDAILPKYESHKYRSGVATPSYLSGMARTLDFFGTFDSYAEICSGPDADVIALQSDFDAVGNDMRWALETVAAENDFEAETPERSKDL